MSRHLHDRQLIVLGGGISGITTAYLLQSLGIRTAIVSSAFAFQRQQSTTPSPSLATFYAMASAYPHNLNVRNLEQVSDDSQLLFEALYKQGFAGLDIYRMYEVFEVEPSGAPLASRRMDFREFSGQAHSLKSLGVPHRSPSQMLSGWTFKTFFADLPVYTENLRNGFLASGGKWLQKELTEETLPELAGGRPLVNCCGLGSIGLFADQSSCVIVRGRQVTVPGAAPVRASDSLPVAYNYTPVAEDFPKADGTAEYVHFFSRSDGWILGQTREPGWLDESGRWQGEENRAPHIVLNGIQIPSPIVELNRQILQHAYNVPMPKNKFFAREGYRYYRAPLQEGVRLEADSRRDILLIHNYGHGGSGVTMSWGCSLQVARLLRSSGFPIKLSRGASANSFARMVLQLLDRDGNLSAGQYDE